MDDKKRNAIIASNIKRLLSNAKITQKKLAEDIGISPSTLSDYMNLRSNPSHGVIQKIADYFAVGKSDIDTTYKEDSDILPIYDQLDPNRKEYVFTVAKNQLEEQNKIVSIRESEFQNLAAHSPDPNKTYTPEKIDEISQRLKEAKNRKKHE